MFFYKAYGLNIHSNFFLSELIKSENQADIYIKKSQVKLPQLETTSINRQGIEAYFGGTGREAYLQWQGVATLLAEDGHTLIVDPDADIEPQLLNLYILSEALGLILYQRRLFLLHASAVKIGEQVIIFAGKPGAGKSTTAAAFAKQGYTVLADDMVAIDLQKFSDELTSPANSKSPPNPPTHLFKGGSRWDRRLGGQGNMNSSSPQSWGARGAMVYPAFPQLKIWESAAKGLGYDLSSLPRLFPGSRKRVIRKPENFPTQPFPLAHIFFLEESNDFTIKPLAGTEAFFYLSRFFPLPSQLLQGEALEKHFQQCIQLISQVDLWKIENPKDFKILNNLINWVERKMEVTLVKEKVCC